VGFPELDLGAFFKPFPHLLQHRVLLEDEERVCALAAAIQAAVRPGDVVLEVGTGTGVLAVLAARAGARRVYAVERTGLAKIAAAVARENGVGSAVRVIHGDALAIRLPERADLLITETLGHLGLEEGLAAIVRDARRRHLKPGARVLPRRLRFLAAPVALPSFSRGVPVPREALVGTGATRVPQAYRRLYKIRWDDARCLAPPAVLWDLDLAAGTGPPPRVSGAVTFGGLRRGSLAGFVAFFEAELALDLVLSSRTGTTWRPVFLPFPASVRVGRASAVRFRLTLAERGPGCHVTWSGVVQTEGSRYPFRLAAGPTG
jgi:SAM-dependent methyltransferase